MNLEIIKILGIFTVTMCCIIAAYTDVKHKIIANKLTLSTIVIGISLVTFYYYSINKFNIFYYLSVLIVFIISYFLWYLGVWAGGDVKLFTAISTLFIPEFLAVIPNFMLFNTTLPYNLLNFRIPTLLLMFNSVISIIPLIVIIIIYEIIKNKTYLINDLLKTFDFKQSCLSLNSLTFSYMIISQFNIVNILLKMIILIILSLVIYKIMQNNNVFLTITVLLLVYQVFTSNLILYLEEFIIISLTIVVKNIYKNGIIREVLTEPTPKTKLEESMILQYPLYRKENNYYFDKSNLYTQIKDNITKKDKGKLIFDTKARGLTVEEIFEIINIEEIDEIPVKKAMAFAPFILCGLILTLTLGNTYSLTTTLMGAL